jgi:uncharacterized membrane protein YbaN (DUF454 family)
VLIRLLWRVLALVLLGVGLIGVFVPVLPTVPFLIAAAWAAGEGWSALETWLVSHRRFGPSIRSWRERGAVSRRVKYWTTVTMASSGVLLLLAPMAGWLRYGTLLLLSAVLAWLWLRPEA